MLTVRTSVIGIYVDRSSRQWIVRDFEGNFWILPPTETPWDDRQPFFPAEETDLEPVPGHYKYMLGIPLVQIQVVCCVARTVGSHPPLAKSNR